MQNYPNNNELYHYGVLGMKWGIRRAAKKGTTYTYKSHGTKKYERKAAKALAKGNTEKANKYNTYAKRSRKLDKGMQNYAKSTSVGKAIAQNLLGSSKTYAISKVATGNNGWVSRGAAAATTYMSGLLGATTVRATYVRDTEPFKRIANARRT